MKANYHTHNYRCKHATGDTLEYVLKAINESYDRIGITDHAPVPKYYEHDYRMTIDEVDQYLQEIEDVKQRYGTQIEVLKGFEVEYFHDHHDYYAFLLTKCDYLVVGIHDFIMNDQLINSYTIENDEQVKHYFMTMIDAIKSGYFKFLAHPDLFAFHYHMSPVAEFWTHELAKICLENDFVLEFNANGLRSGFPYPYKPFWDIIKRYHVKVVVNSDCHHASYLNDEFDQKAFALAKEYGLHIVEDLF